MFIQKKKKIKISVFQIIKILIIRFSNNTLKSKPTKLE